MPLWPKSDSAPPAAPETVVERGKGRPDRAIANVSNPTLTVYLPAPERRTGAAVVICPGGGYERVVIDKEGHDVARWLSGLGITSFVLKYRIPTAAAEIGQVPAPIADGLHAIRLVRSGADKWKLDPARIGIVGFSAGGHLASSVGTHFDGGRTESADPVERVSSRPDFMVLVYPVVSMDPAVTHQGSRMKLLGSSPSDQMVRLYSNELRVTDLTPPTFIVHAKDDAGVLVENSVRLAAALRMAKVPVELRLLEQGGHGFGLGIHGGEPAQWPQVLAAWLKQRNVLPASETAAEPTR